MEKILIDFQKKYPNAFRYKAQQPCSLKELKLIWKSKTINFLQKINISESQFVIWLRLKLGISNKYISVISFYCGEGWRPIVENIAEELDKTKNVYFLQVKEKLGGLRIYLDGSTDKLKDMIKDAEEESLQTCEECGTKADVTTEGSWIKTLCQTCRNKRYKKPL